MLQQDYKENPDQKRCKDTRLFAPIWMLKESDVEPWKTTVFFLLSSNEEPGWASDLVEGLEEAVSAAQVEGFGQIYTLHFSCSCLR